MEGEQWDVEGHLLAQREDVVARGEDEARVVLPLVGEADLGRGGGEPL